MFTRSMPGKTLYSFLATRETTSLPPESRPLRCEVAESLLQPPNQGQIALKKFGRQGGTLANGFVCRCGVS